MEHEIIDAMPTKELFIDMLTRDIPLIPAIIDLVDNCADGARKLRGEKSYKDLWARIEFSPARFRIADNCGGISVEVAKKYAFRFGRVAKTPSVKHSIGEFGVGMKRAIFKMGNKFKVESNTTNSHFVVDEDVRAWAKKIAWNYEFKELAENTNIAEKRQGTQITVSDLHSDVSETFKLGNFTTALVDGLKSKLQVPISKGLAISLNGIPINAPPLELIGNNKLAPAFKALHFGDSSNRVNVKLYCGLGKDSSPLMAGWHIFCNGRLILEADQTETSGWGNKSDGINIPGFHGQYNHLRGYAYFDSDDPGRLPWNTTKTGVDQDSPIYRATRLEMMRLMRPVVDFLNRLKEEKASGEDNGDSGPGPLTQLIMGSKSISVDDVKTRSLFEQPEIPPPRLKAGPPMQRIQYFMPADKVALVKKAIDAKSFTQVGEKTFLYFFEAEIKE